MAECDPNEVIQACWACRPPKEVLAGIVGLLCDISSGGGGGSCPCFTGEHITGTSYTVLAGDDGKVLLFDAASTITVTLPNDLPQGFMFVPAQIGFGQVVFEVEAGGTLVPVVPGDNALSGRYAAGKVNVISNSGTDAAWGLCGDTASAGGFILDLVYVLQESDNGTTLTFGNSVAQVVVVPAGLSNGFSVNAVRGSTGMLHVFARTGVTVSSATGYRVDTAGTATISIAGTTATIAGNITTDLVESGGLPTGSFSNDNGLAQVTMIDDLRNNGISVVASAMRQDGFMRGVKFLVRNSTGAAGAFNWRIFRPNSVGPTFDFVGKTEAFAVPVPEIGLVHTERFTTPVACRGSDVAGAYTVNAADSLSVKNGSAANTCRIVAADVQASNTFPTVINFLLNHQVLSWSPLWGTTGDSIIGGSNTGATAFVPYQQGGPSGGVAAQIQYQLRSSVGDSLEFINNARAAQDFTFCKNTGVPACITSKAAWIHIHCGVNDIAAGRLWSAIESDLDAIKALLVNGERLIIDEILPWTAGTDGNAATIRTFNANLATWCTANGATLIVCHDTMGQLRVSTGFLDDLKTAYNQDGTHLTAAGVTEMAVIFQAAFGLT
jgi:hypothetical protein